MARTNAERQAAYRARNGWHQFKDRSPPKGEMFIWARHKGHGRWGLGLGYWNVSGGWSDAYGDPASRGATHWKSIGDPPKI